MNRFISDADFLAQCSSAAGQYVKGRAGASEMIIETVHL
jgi:hypothetical protein